MSRLNIVWDESLLAKTPTKPLSIQFEPAFEGGSEFWLLADLAGDPIKFCVLDMPSLEPLPALTDLQRDIVLDAIRSGIRSNG